VAFVADRSVRAVSRMYHGIVGKLQNLASQRIHHLLRRTTPEINPSYAPCEKRISSEQLRRGNDDLSSVRGEKQARATRRVARGVEHLSAKISPAQGVSLTEILVHFRQLWRSNTEKRGLLFHGLIQWNVLAVHQHRGPCIFVHFTEAAYVIYVRMCADDRLYIEAVPAEQVHDPRYFVAGIEHQSFSSDGIGDDRAIALQDADRQAQVNKARHVSMRCRSDLMHEKSIASAEGPDRLRVATVC